MPEGSRQACSRRILQSSNALSYLVLDHSWSANARIGNPSNVPYSLDNTTDIIVDTPTVTSEESAANPDKGTNGISMGREKRSVLYLMLEKSWKVKILVLLMSLSATPAIANNEPSEFKFFSSFGLGTQYAGILGAQFGMDNQKHKAYGAIGLLGLGVGYNFALNENFSVGVNAFQLVVVAGYGLNVNYYLGSTFFPGWMVGVDWIRASAVIGGERSTTALLSLGYEF